MASRTRASFALKIALARRIQVSTLVCPFYGIWNYSDKEVSIPLRDGLEVWHYDLVEHFALDSREFRSDGSCNSTSFN